jgi:hypothetical protein
LSRWDVDLQRVIGAFRVVVFAQALAQPESRFWSKSGGRFRASTAMLYSLICSAHPSKCIEHT